MASVRGRQDHGDLTGDFCTSPSERLEDRKDPGNAQENIRAEQIVTKLRQIEVLVSQGKTVPAACKEAGITAQTIAGARNMAACRWNKPRR
jgi:hypothetical protein